MTKKPSSSQEPQATSKPAGDEKPRRHDHDGDDGEQAERLIFQDLVQRRLGGGAPPSAEAYAKAMQQWQKLAGAVQFVAVPLFPGPDSGASPTLSEPPDKPGDGAVPT